VSHPSAITTWHRLVQTRDTAGLAELLAEDAVFHSPVVHSPVQGRQQTLHYLSAAFTVFFNDTFQYVREVIDEGHAVLEFEVLIDGVRVNGVDMIAWNEQGQIVDFKVMLRPLKAINLIHQKMGLQLGAAR
jgi:ketosteroid isomerase-like protein